MPPEDDEGDDRPDVTTLVEAKRTRLGVGDSFSQLPLIDLVGDVIEGYFVEAELGAGAMGRVYRATHVETGEVVAIKALHPRHLGDPEIVARFRREALMAARLSHPNIAGVVNYGVSLDDGRHLIIYELAEGEALSAILTMPLPPERIVELVSQILRGLDHAHEAGLIHRDLKPDNIMVSWQDGREHVRIVDFGIAILRDDNDAALERLTQTGQMIGTPIYMSPEQAKCEPFDHRTDLFALGVIVYEMLSGTLPFSGTSLEIALANVNKDPPPMAKRAPEVLVDPLLEAFCRKLMARRLDARFASARQALEALEMDVPKALALVSLPTRS